MTPQTIKIFFNGSLAFCVMVFTLILLVQDSRAQDLQIPDVGGGGGATVNGAGQIDQGSGDFGQQAIGGGGGGVGGGGIGDGVGQATDLLEAVDLIDVRNRGFVGSAAPRIIEQGFVGPPGEQTGPPLGDGATFGGGVNDGQTVGGGGGGGGAGGGGGQRNGFGGVGGQEKGFQVQRKGIRTSLSPRFAAPQLSANEIGNRFQSRLSRQPMLRNDNRSMTVRIENRTAIVSGFAGSQAEQDRFIRQLRLEPGIDRIKNQVQVSQ